jgi:hypothetical protein
VPEPITKLIAVGAFACLIAVEFDEVLPTSSYPLNPQNAQSFSAHYIELYGQSLSEHVPETEGDARINTGPNYFGSGYGSTITAITAPRTAAIELVRTRSGLSSNSLPSVFFARVL